MGDMGRAAGSVWVCGKKGGAGMAEVCVCWKESITTETQHTVGRICQQACPSLEKRHERWVQDPSSQPAWKLAVFLKLPSKRDKEDAEDQLLFMAVSDRKAGPASEL